MSRLLVLGIGTDIGKTVVAAILTELFEADYWKPVQSGEVGDSEIMERLIDAKRTIHPPIYSFKAPLSPHHAARLEDQRIDLGKIVIPKTSRSLIIEGVGGCFVPLCEEKTTLDLFTSWRLPTVLVSRHYLGSINHTLMSCELLQKRGIPLCGIFFNGKPNRDSEEAILKISKLPLLARLHPETKIDKQTIQRYRRRWKKESIYTLI